MAANAERTVSTTTDHDEIRRWIEARNGRPATVRGTGRYGLPGMLRVEFRDDDDDLEPVAWDAFFTKFDGDNLAFLHGEGASRFNKFVRR